MGYYDLNQKFFVENSFELFIERKLTNESSFQIGILTSNFSNRFTFDITHPIEEDEIIISEERFWRNLCLGIKIGFNYPVKNKLRIFHSISMFETINTHNNLEYLISPVFVFFDIPKQETASIQYGEFPGIDGSIDNYLFLETGIEYELIENISIFLGLKAKPFGNATFYRLEIVGDTISINGEKTQNLNNTKIIDRFFLLGIGLKYRI